MCYQFIRITNYIKVEPRYNIFLIKESHSYSILIYYSSMRRVKAERAIHFPRMEVLLVRENVMAHSLQDHYLLDPRRIPEAGVVLEEHKRLEAVAEVEAHLAERPHQTKI